LPLVSLPRSLRDRSSYPLPRASQNGAWGLGFALAAQTGETRWREKAREGEGSERWRGAGREGERAPVGLPLAWGGRLKFGQVPGVSRKKDTPSPPDILLRVRVPRCRS
jgi:hypothetical protein